MKNQVSIAIVTFNNEDNISKCIESILKQDVDTEIIILDNASTDNTIEKIKGYPKVKLIENIENVGFGRGHNKAIKKATGEYLLILNPDTEILDQSLKKMLEYLENEQNVGLVAPKLLKENGEVQKSVRKFPNIWGAFREYFLNQKNQYSEYAPLGDTPVSIEVVYGAVMLLKRELFREIKGFEERYFLYYEDLDLCRKISKLSLKIIYFPQAEFKHLIGSSTKQVKVSKLPFGIRTLAHFIPMTSSGSLYYQVRSGYTYHGVLTGFLIRLILYFSQKTGLYKQN